MAIFRKKTSSWDREPDDLGRRIEGKDVKNAGLNRPFVVQTGVSALVFTEGLLKGRLEPGKYDVDGILKRFMFGESSTTLVLVEDGQTPLEFFLDNLCSDDQVNVSCWVRFVTELSSPENFYRNLMRDRTRFKIGELQDRIRPEVRTAIASFVAGRSVEAVFKGDPSALSSIVSASLAPHLDTLGFRIVSISGVEFASDAYGGHLNRSGEVEMASKDADLEALRSVVKQRLRETIVEDLKHKALTKSDFRNQVNQIIHDLRIKDRLRDDEFRTLRTRLELDLEDLVRERERSRGIEDLEHAAKLDRTARAHNRSEDALDLDASLEGHRKAAETDEAVRDLRRAGDEKDLDVRRRKLDDKLDAMARLKEMEAEEFRKKAETLQNADTATKIALGVGDAASLVELERIARQQDLSEDALMILAAKDSPAVAAALAERFRAEGKSNEEVMEGLRRELEATKTMKREDADRLERVMQEALKNMGKVASSRATAQGGGGQTIVTGGQGQPTIVNPNPQPPAPPASGKDDPKPD